MKIDPQELQRLLDKWKHVLDFDITSTTPLSANRTIAMLIESQEKWHTKEEVERATPKNNL